MTTVRVINVGYLGLSAEDCQEWIRSGKQKDFYIFIREVVWSEV